MLIYYLRNFLKPEIYGPGYRGLIKQGFYEAPYLTITGLGLPFVFSFIPFLLYKHKKLDSDRRRFIDHYTVMRPNDPRLKFFYRVVDRTQQPETPKNGL